MVVVVAVVVVVVDVVFVFVDVVVVVDDAVVILEVVYSVKPYGLRVTEGAGWSLSP